MSTAVAPVRGAPREVVALADGRALPQVDAELFGPELRDRKILDVAAVVGDLHGDAGSVTEAALPAAEDVAAIATLVDRVRGE